MFDVWMSVVGISMGLSTIPQIIKIIKRKKADDISIVLWIIILHGLFWWLIKGIYEGDISLIITNSFCIVIDTILILLILKYRTKRRKYERAALDS